MNPEQRARERVERQMVCACPTQIAPPPVHKNHQQGCHVPAALDAYGELMRALGKVEALQPVYDAAMDTSVGTILAMSAAANRTSLMLDAAKAEVERLSAALMQEGIASRGAERLSNANYR